MNKVSYNDFVKGVCNKVSKEWIEESKNLYIAEAKKMGYDLPKETAIQLAVESFNEMLQAKFKECV